MGVFEVSADGVFEVYWEGVYLRETSRCRLCDSPTEGAVLARSFKLPGF